MINLKSLLHRPVVILGNSFSVNSINYQRLPKDCLTVRFNHFFYEEDYFLGKKVDFHFIADDPWQVPGILYQNMQCVAHSIYEIDRVFSLGFSPKTLKNLWSNSYFFNPLDCIKMHSKASLIATNYFLNFPFATTGLLSLLTLISVGFKEFYIAGIDFQNYLQNRFYSFNLPPNVNKIHTMRKINPANNPHHSSSIDQACLDHILKIFESEIQIFSISEKSMINSMIPMAPLRSECFYSKQSKSQWIDDIPDYFVKESAKRNQFFFKVINKIRQMLDH